MTVYIVKEGILVNQLSFLINNEVLKRQVESLPNSISYIIYFLVVACCTLFSMLLAKGLSCDRIARGSIITIETANDAFLPSYLGYFFVALSVPDYHTFLYVFGTIFVFIYFSKISYFNPIFLIFGYKFFYLTESSGLKIVVITKQELKVPSEVSFNKLRRINNYTFITSE